MREPGKAAIIKGNARPRRSYMALASWLNSSAQDNDGRENDRTYCPSALTVHRWAIHGLKPAPPAPIAAATENEQCDEYDQKGVGIHDVLLWICEPSGG